ncbi:hypothetical protein [Methylobacterium organophilum]|uniref:Uncharacterized protein n=1 Tax=Methylobacterium organophilum TaxID=410 RepID=A0ABQ4TBR6_METOR|nr:hypothetical protein [Methylobacterium organophilum]GJE27939.1 hypothetical protein LKMONMHP_2801 [Methylobacterium organophilum]
MVANLDLLGPASAVGAVTSRPSDTRIFGGTDTWFAPCSSQANRDGTQLQAVWANALLAQLRYAIRASGIDLDNADDAMLWKAIASRTPGPALWHHGTDTSNAAAVVSAAVSPVIASYEPFVAYIVKVAHDSVDGGTQANLGAGLRNVVRPDGTAIRRGDWVAGQTIVLLDDGTALQLHGIGSAPAPLYRGTNSGSVNTIVASLSPSPARYEVDALYIIGLSGSNTGPVTADLNGFGPRNVVRSNGNALRPGDISRVAALTYDGTNLVLLNLAQEIAPPGSGFTGTQQRFAYLPQTGVNSRLSASFTATFAGVVLVFSTLNSSPSNGNISNSATVSVNGNATTGAGDSISGASTSIASAKVSAGDAVTVSSDCQPSQSIQFPASQYLTYLFIPG